MKRYVYITLAVVASLLVAVASVLVVDHVRRPGYGVTA